jgi:hypothetical protein
MTRTKSNKKGHNRPKGTSRELTLASLPEDPVDRMLATDFVLVRLGREVRRHQGLLRESCSEEAWRAYLRIEELMNERMFTFADKWIQRNPKTSTPTHTSKKIC